MVRFALSLLAGIVSLNFFAELPGAGLYLVSICALLAWCSGRLRRYGSTLLCIAGYLFGMSWAQFHAVHHLRHVLPESLAGVDVVVTGRIADIPVADEKLQRFLLDVRHLEVSGYTGPVPERIKLSWYYGEPVRAGESWRLNVRLKPPHGFMNPGGFDYEAWLFQHGIHATGYVRKATGNRRLAKAGWGDAARIREHIAQRIGAALCASEFAGLVMALGVGSRSGIDREQWQVLVQTGTNHLIAISGLHIGLAAAFGYGLSRRLIPVRLMPLVPAQHLATVCAVLAASVYAMLAGFAIPTQRALLMLLCFGGAAWFRRTTRPQDVLMTALVVVLLWDPASVMSPGVWFSFLAVAVIFYAITGRSARFRWLQWGRLQVVIALALFPLSLFMFQQVSLIAPLANFVLVPYVSLLVVPLILLGMLLLPAAPAAAAMAFNGAGALLELAWPVLEWLSNLPGSHWVKSEPGLPATLIALAGVAVLLAPRSGLLRLSGVFLLLPALLSEPQRPAAGAYELTVLDVGQGLAVVVRTRNRTLVYDTGARFSDRLDSGEAVLLPFLRRAGVRQIDRLVISHGDGDHIGGADSVLAAYPDTAVLGQDVERLSAASRAHCEAGQGWEWDGVAFTLLHPDHAVYAESNNRSCVLRVDGEGGSLLLAGDIEKNVEQRLVREVPEALPADILVAPHHGSNTSSTVPFIEAVAPRIVIFAAGYRNRYHFPTAKVVRRYRALGAAMFTSGHSGALRIRVDPRQGISRVESYREDRRKYWHHRAPELRQDG